MKKVNPFILVKQYFYTDDEYDPQGNITSHGDMSTWVDEDYLEDFKGMWEEQLEAGEIRLEGERTLKGVEYNEKLIGSIYGDFEGKFTDEECTICQHLLVTPSLSSGHKDPTGNERQCSNYHEECNWMNDELKEWYDEDKKWWQAIRDKPDPPKFRVEGQTLAQFCEKYGFSRDLRGDYSNHDCKVCKRLVPVADFYRTKDMAIITYEHEDCTNQGPSIIIPQGEQAKKWKELLF